MDEEWRKKQFMFGQLSEVPWSLIVGYFLDYNLEHAFEKCIGVIVLLRGAFPGINCFRDFSSKIYSSFFARIVENNMCTILQGTRVKSLSLCKLIEETKSTIAGGFVISCLLGKKFPHYDGCSTEPDIDIYISVSEVDRFLSGLRNIVLVKDMPTFTVTELELSYYAFKSGVYKILNIALQGMIPIQLIVLQKICSRELGIMYLISGFDITICQCTISQRKGEIGIYIEDVLSLERKELKISLQWKKMVSKRWHKEHEIRMSRLCESTLCCASNMSMEKREDIFKTSLSFVVEKTLRRIGKVCLYVKSSFCYFFPKLICFFCSTFHEDFVFVSYLCQLT